MIRTAIALLALLAAQSARACLMGEGPLTKVYPTSQDTTYGVVSAYVTDADGSVHFMFTDDTGQDVPYNIAARYIISAPANPQCSFSLSYYADPVFSDSFGG